MLGKESVSSCWLAAEGGEGGALHLRIKEAGGCLDNGGKTIVGLDLVQDALCVCDDGGKLQPHVLGLHVERKGEGEALGLAGLDGVVVLHGRQVAQDALVGGGALGQRLGGGQETGQEGDLDGAILLVGDFDEGPCRAAVDEADTEDVCVGEGGFDVGGQVGLLGGGAAVGGGGIGLDIRETC
jgi:hypothetical protein